MFKRIVEIGGKFYIMKGIFMHMWWEEKDDYFWYSTTKYRTEFDSADDAKKAWSGRRVKFVSWL